MIRRRGSGGAEGVVSAGEIGFGMVCGGWGRDGSCGKAAPRVTVELAELGAECAERCSALQIAECLLREHIQRKGTLGIDHGGVKV